MSDQISHLFNWSAKIKIPPSHSKLYVVLLQFLYNFFILFEAIKIL